MARCYRIVYVSVPDSAPNLRNALLVASNLEPKQLGSVSLPSLFGRVEVGRERFGLMLNRSPDEPGQPCH